MTDELHVWRHPVVLSGNTNHLVLGSHWGNIAHNSDINNDYGHTLV